MNHTFLYILATAATVAVVAAAAFLIRALIRLQPLIERLDGTAQFLETSRPKIDRILDGLETELVELRGISEKLNRIAGHAESVTTGLKVAVQPLITEVSDFTRLIGQARAVAIAVKTGLLAWRDRGRHEDADPESEIEYDEESRG
ncbi:MAG: hypothetical protein IPH09_16925 [bacterium]|nr:hypothetical protein [bacterium]MBK7703544.1 hypothetical protein [bacterium]MBK9304752.1 hypothetical protein [bacterium]